jgi:hypothetical protein
MMNEKNLYMVQFRQVLLYLTFLLILLPNTDLLVDYVRGCTWQLKKVETIYRFHKSVYEETAAFNFSMEPLKTIGCGSRFQSDIVGGKMILIFVELLHLTLKIKRIFYSLLIILYYHGIPLLSIRIWIEIKFEFTIF